MKKTVLSFLAICIAITTIQAQNEPVNPFEEFGYKPKIATLSKGKYVEFYDQDTIVQIGGAVFNTVTMKIMGFVEYDTIRSEYNISPEVISRWLSPDPLTNEFPSWSPYNYVNDNPIIFVDPDGQYPIYFVTRSYAPFKTFGVPGDKFYGDDRGHTLDKGASYRTMVSIMHDTELRTTEAYGGRSRSHNVKGTKDAISETQVDNKTKPGSNSLDIHSYGNNAAQPGSWDIDQFTKVTADIIGNVKKTHILHVSGTISGDNFPSQESMIYDTKGNTLWLGNFATSGNSVTGPTLDLSGENEGNVNINIDVYIKVNRKGVFQGVIQGDKTYTISEWNKQFESDDK